MIKNIGISGLGFVGTAVYESFKLKGYEENVNLFVYDKYKNGGIGKMNDLLNTDIIFLALPTLFDETQNKYDLTALEENLEILNSNRYSGGVIIKSTLEPGTTEKYSKLYNLNLIHNPEFLTTRTALQDFHNQTHIVIGNCKGCDEKIIESVHEFYKLNYPDASISKCTSTESESMKLFVNCFYATKVQFFTELYLLCEKINVNYKIVKDLMLMNGWINPMHTTVPGPDGNISYGGLCFPKDTNALLHFMKINDVPHKVLENVVSERNSMREDNNNIIKNKIE